MKTIDEQLEELGRWRRELGQEMMDKLKRLDALLEANEQGECLCRFCLVHVTWGEVEPDLVVGIPPDPLRRGSTAYGGNRYDSGRV